MNVDVIGEPAAPGARSPAAQRMQAHRERRRLGLRCITIQLRATEIGELIERGLLKNYERNDQIAIRDPLHAHLDLTLRKTAKASSSP
jgi:hypothetical protein